MISVVMPAYNCEATISESIQSVLDQSFEDFELLICDDGSDDSTKLIIKDFIRRDNRITLLDNIYCKGASGARNTCLVNARNKFVAFLDSDDLWHKDKLRIQLDFMVENKVAASYGDYYMFGNKLDNMRLISTKSTIDFHNLTKTCDIGCLTMMINRSLTGPFLFPFMPKEDYALWLSLSKLGFVFEKYPGKLAYYRKQQYSASSSKIKEVSKQWLVLRDVGKISFLRRLYCILTYVYFGLIKHR